MLGGGRCEAGWSLRGRGLWSHCGRIPSWALQGQACIGPTGPGNIHPHPPCARHSPRPRGAPPLIDAESLGFVIPQLMVSIPAPQKKQQPELGHFSLCGPSGFWSVYSKVQASEENLLPYHGIKGAVGCGREGCASLLLLFQGSLLASCRRVVILFSLSSSAWSCLWRFSVMFSGIMRIYFLLLFQY